MDARRYTIFDNLQEGVQILSPEGKYLYLNEVVAVHAKRNRKELLGSNIKKEYPGIENTVLYTKIQACLQQQEKEVFVNDFIFPNKSAGYFLLRLEPVEEGVIIMSTDITQLKKEGLEAISETYYKTLIETISDVITLFDSSGKVIFRTPSAEKVIGYSTEDMFDRSGFDLVHPDDRNMAQSVFDTVLNTPKGTGKAQYRIQHKNGQYIHIEGTFKNLLHDKQVNAILYSYHDITEKVQAIERLDRYNQEITLLNKINNIILHADREQELLQLVCTNLIQNSSYTACWIGVSDKNKKVKPIYYYANNDKFDIKYIKEIYTQLDYSITPSAKVLSTGQKVITNNISANKTLTQWVKYAQDSGIESLLALPLEINNERLVLNIYSSKKNAFDEREINVLERLTFKVILAANALRTQQEKEKAKYDLGERVKELSTIYHVNKILQDEDAAIDDIFKRIVATLPAGWQYPDNCEACIHFDGKQYTSAGYKDSTFKQTVTFKLTDGRTGSIDIIYIEEKTQEYEGCFLKEERDLLDTIANAITVYFNKIIQKKTLKESETRFRAAFEDVAIGMALVSIEGKFLKINNSLCEMLGYTKKQLLERRFHDITYADDLYDDEAYIKEMLNGKKDFYRTEKRYLKSNGEIVWINLNVALIKDTDGTPLYFVSQLENITEKKKINAQLFENEHQLRLFVEHSPASLAMFDMDMKYILTSKRWVTDYNLEGKTVIGKSHYELFPTIPERWIKIHKKCLAGAIEKCAEDSFVGEDGKLLWISWEIRPWKKITGEVGGIIMFTEVITEQVETKLKYQTLVEKSVVGVYIIQDNKFVYVNPRMLEQSGYTKDELLSVDLEKFIHPDDHEVVTTNMRNRLDGKISDSRYELRIRNKQGENIWLEVLATTTTYNGKAAIMGTMINITDKKNLELERQQMITDLVAKNRDLEQFSNILSHNLRAPISTILGLTSLLNEDSNAEELTQYLKGIEQSASQLDIVIKDLNEILHIKHSLTEIKTDVRFDEIVKETKDILADTISAKKAIIQPNFKAVNTINTVRSYMSSIFYNMISNALKYTRPGIAPVINITSSIEEGKIVLKFKDNGIGLDLNKHQDQVFGLYKRFHYHVEGKGLGLFIVKTQVEALHGTIEVNSVPNKGTEFVLKFIEEQEQLKASRKTNTRL